MGDGDYCWADGKSVSTYDSTVVAISTDVGITGYGEVVPLGPNYLPSYAPGVQTGLKELGPKLLGRDPTSLTTLNAFMDYELKGHPYVKSAIDMACWDILGKSAGLSVNTLLGGNFSPQGIKMYRAIGQSRFYLNCFVTWIFIILIIICFIPLICNTITCQTHIL